VRSAAVWASNVPALQVSATASDADMNVVRI
jgi:hypothetical protein